VAQPPDEAVRHYLAMVAIAASIATTARRIWGELEPARLDQSWASKRIGQRIAVTVGAGQMLAAQQADSYLDGVLAAQGIDIDRAASVQARSFAGVASDGRSLGTLFYEPVIATKTAIEAKAGTDAALARGEHALLRAVSTQLADAGRTAVGVGMVARPAVTRWARMLNPPSCSRCAVLAGRTYRWNAGFDRHPLCDCIAIPSTDQLAPDLTTDPASYFDSLDGAAQDRYFSAAGAQAIRDGANIPQVVNASRATAGLSKANGRTATSHQPSSTARLMPETIIEDAADRADAIALLRSNGYLV